MKLEKDCKYPFAITCKSKINGFKTCEIDMKDGYTMAYMPVPHGVRFSFASITRFYRTDEGQKIIEDELKRINS